MTMKKEKVKKSIGREILEWVMVIVVAVAVALCIRTFGFTFVGVDGVSMNDTLQNKEVMLVTKMDYLMGEPQRFDVVICHYPNRVRAGWFGIQEPTDFVKRIVGLPGDTVEILEGYLYVNGTKYDEPYINDEYRVRGGSDGYTFPAYTVPEGCYFVMGDHRNNSNDSRAQGPLTRDMIVGHARQIVFPFNAWRSIP